MRSGTAEHDPLLGNINDGVPAHLHHFRVYWSRWWVLAFFSLLNLNQSILFVCFSPIANTAKSYFHTTDYWINLQVGLGCAIYIPFLFLTSYVLEKRGGFRFSMLLCSGLQLLAGTVRLLALIHPSSPFSMMWVTLGTLLNNVISPLTMSAPSLISASWFPEYQRTTATAIAAMSGWAGSAIGYVMIPGITNRFGVAWLMYFQAILCVVVNLPVFFYYPSAPPTPPSASAAVADLRRGNRFLSNLGKAIFDPSFMAIVLLAGSQQGVVTTWMTMLDQILSTIHYTQMNSGYIAMAATLGGLAGGMLIGPVADRYFQRRLRLLSLLLTAGALIVTLEFALCFPSPILRTRVITLQSLWFFILLAAASGLCVGGSVPILYELCAELIFPVPEGTSVGLFTLFTNLACLVFSFSTKFIPDGLMSWINALSVASVVITLLFIKERYNRNVAKEIV